MAACTAAVEKLASCGRGMWGAVGGEEAVGQNELDGDREVAKGQLALGNELQTSLPTSAAASRSIFLLIASAVMPVFMRTFEVIMCMHLHRNIGCRPNKYTKSWRKNEQKGGKSKRCCRV